MSVRPPEEVDPVSRRIDARPSSVDGERAPKLRPSPKRDGGVRWLTQLDPDDELAYREAVSALILPIERSLGPEVVANRARWGSGAWRLTRWAARAAWDRRISSAIRAASPRTVFAVTDVRACYPATSPRAILRTLGPASLPVVRLLERFVDAGVRGLPIGPDPSAVLANAVLARLDGALRRSGVRHVRWVDDVVLWGERADVVHALAATHRAAAELQLELHETKTRILDDRDELRAPSIRSCRSGPAFARTGDRRLSSRRREDPLPRFPRRHAFASDDG